MDVVVNVPLIITVTPVDMIELPYKQKDDSQGLSSFTSGAIMMKGFE